MGNYEATAGPFNQHDALNLYLEPLMNINTFVDGPGIRDGLLSETTSEFN